MLKLYELTVNYMNLLELEDQIPAEMLKEALDNVESDLSEKFENIGKLLAEIDGSIAALKAEEQRLAAKRKMLENRHTNIKEYAFDSLKAMGMTKMSTPLFSYSIRKSPGSVGIVDEALIPAEYYQTKFELSKKLILEKLKAGENVPGAELVVGENLSIK